MKMKEFDVKTAFLYGEIEEEVYLEQPEGFGDGSGRVYQMKQRPFCIQQSPQCWNKRFIIVMNMDKHVSFMYYVFNLHIFGIMW